MRVLVRGSSAGWVVLLLVLCVIQGVVEKGHAEVIDFWIPTWNAAVQKWLDEEAIPAFERENPGHRIGVVYGTWNDYADKLVVAFASGTFPDVYVIAAADSLVHIRQGWAAPLEKYIAQWGQKHDYLPVALGPTNVGGHQYGMPWSIQGHVMLMRRSAALEAGVPDRVPATWEEFKTAARRMTKVEGDTVTRLGYTMPGDQPFLTWVQAAGGELFSPDFSRAVINSPEAETGLAFLVELHQLLVPAGVTTGPVDFALGSVGMVQQEPTYLANLRVSDVEALRDVTVGPTPKGARQVVRAYVPNLAIGSPSKKKDLAWQWIAFLHRAENVLAYNTLYGRLSPRSSHFRAGYLKDTPQLVDVLTLYANFGVPHLMPVAMNIMRKPVQTQLKKALAGEVSPREALAEVARAWQVEIDKAK